MNSQVQQIIVYEHSLGEITVITAYCTYTVHDMYFMYTQPLQRHRAVQLLW